MRFEEMFKTATGFDPYPYQRRLAESSELPCVLDIPTGAGKTGAVVLSWLWRRVHLGLLNNDVLWIMDETQSLGVAVETSAQLHAFRRSFGTYGPSATEGSQ